MHEFAKTIYTACGRLWELIQKWVVRRKFLNDEILPERSRVVLVRSASINREDGGRILLERIQIIEELLPGSNSHLAARLRQPLHLPSGEQCDCIIMSRGLIFRTGYVENVVSYLFSDGLRSEGTRRYRLDCLLDQDGEYEFVDETTMQIIGKRRIGRPRHFTRTDDRFSEMCTLADSFLFEVGRATYYETRPLNHDLLRPLKVEFGVIER